MAQAVALTGGNETMGTITGAVIAHDALSFDAKRGEVSQGAFEEEDGTLLAFVRQD